MKNRLAILFLTLILLTSCLNEYKSFENSNITVELNQEIEYINKLEQLELIQTDNVYGEWGGDTDVIKLYSDGKNIYANYARYLGKEGPPDPFTVNDYSKKWYEFKKLDRKQDSIKLKDRQIVLIKSAILELTKLKIENRTYPSIGGGIVNEVVSRDSSLIIQHYPSNQWKSFQDLKHSFTGKLEQ
jgi:hypothetical protein